MNEWLRHERARLTAASTRLLERLCEMETGPLRVEAARRLLSLDPLRESSHRILMRAYLAQGDKSLALKAVRRVPRPSAPRASGRPV